jgi:hypothetical protein
MATFYYTRQNDTAPVVDTLEDSLGVAISLVGATVQFHAIDRLGATILNKAATGPLGNPFDTSGQVRLPLLASETATAGTFFAEWEVTFAGGVVQTWPQNESAIWVIYPDLI